MLSCMYRSDNGICIHIFLLKDNIMNGILLISHGNYADELKNSLKMIAGEVDSIYSVGLDFSDGPDEFKEKLQNIEPKLDKYSNVIVFSDLLGGSPSNTAFQYFLKKEHYQFIAGMNFPMVLSTILENTQDPNYIINLGKESIIDLRKFSESILSCDDED